MIARMMRVAAGRRGVSAAAIAALFVSVGSSDAQPGKPDPESAKSACLQLTGQTIPSSSIGLPTGAATVTSGTFVPAQSTSGHVTPHYCKVLGTIAPVDSAAQLIYFQLNLPFAWNGKALQYGGGGFNGTLITGLAPLRDAAPGDPLPLARGYATLGTDSGHQSASSRPIASASSD